MEYRSSEVKAGLFIFVSMIGLVVMIFMIGNIQDYFKPRKMQRIIFNFTGGMEVGAPVRYAGLDIGSVKDIELLGSKNDKGMDRVAVIAEITPTIIIKKNSVAMIKTAGLMGGLYIDIRPGTTESPTLGKNEELIGQDSFEIAKIGDMATEIVMEIRRFTQLTEDLVADVSNTLKGVRSSVSHIDAIFAENRPSIRANMDNALKISDKVSNISDKVSNILDNNSGKLGSALDNVASVSKKADTLLTDKDTEIREIIGQMHNLTREMEILLADTRPGVTSLINSMETNAQEISTQIDRTANNVEQTLDQGNAIMVENRRNLLELLKNMNQTSRNLKSLTEELNRNPWKLVRKSDEAPVTPDEMSSSGKPDVRMKRLDKISSK